MIQNHMNYSPKEIKNIMKCKMFILLMINCCISELEVIQKFAEASPSWRLGVGAAALAV